MTYTESIDYQPRHRSRIIVLISVAAALIGFTTVALLHNSPSARADQGTTPAATAAVQTNWLCNQASNAESTNTATPFMSWVNQKCTTQGAAAMAAASTAAGAQSAASATPGAQSAATGTATNSRTIGQLICQYAAAQVTAGTATSTDKVQNSLCNQPNLPQESGILATPESQPSGSDIAVSNEWIGPANGVTEHVFAGSQSAWLAAGGQGNPKLGDVLVWNTTGNVWKAYLTSALDGALTITSASATTLLLQAADGTAYTFTLATNTLSAG